ncbi:adenylate/guanylate cyclase domain-containing protein [Pseudomonas frederiksbergensis]|uniref:adenylate/guanylate cyclase domain-containing protein n=1 Tax=Pseudomonas frederiksbergensis TaxID=104087 RepID=UPI002181FB32|nr:adenylate/guanylate cyclase domain-containing protein [Pseudomonas frederiksbergensis]
MSRMKEVFGSFEMEPQILKSAQAMDSARSVGMVAESASLEQISNIESHDYNIQRKLRELFGKSGLNSTPIGGHPHFDHLKDSGGLENGYATTLFVDIQGSTRLGVFYAPELVFYIKNQIIKCAIEAILAFDGHVHRIMGDAVLAFFRSDGNNPRNSAIDAINCGSVLVQFIREEVVPKLRLNGLEEDVGIRVGIDYGAEKTVLWGMYGYTGVSEVTATSFHVDIAAKLQQSAPRNRVMLGESLVNLLDLHDQVVEVKRGKKGEDTIDHKFVRPNYTDSNGQPMNYRQYVISQDKYFGLLPSPADDSLPIRIESTLKNKAGIQSDDKYHRCSRSIKQDHGVDFKALFYTVGNPQNVEVKFRVENHGTQASEESDNGNHETVVAARQRVDGSYFANRWEGTSYIGLHYMFVSVLEDGVVRIPEQCYGVFVG